MSVERAFAALHLEERCPVADETCLLCLTCYKRGGVTKRYADCPECRGICATEGHVVCAHGGEVGNCADCAIEKWEDGIDLEAKEVGRAD